MDLIASVTWICAALSLYGTYLNIKQDRDGFIFWMIANTFWIWYNYSIGTYALSVQFGIYLILAYMGYRSWEKTANAFAENHDLRNALERIRIYTSDTCHNCGTRGQDYD